MTIGRAATTSTLSTPMLITAGFIGLWHRPLFFLIGARLTASGTA